MPGRASTRARCTSARRGHHEDAVEAALAAGLEEQRDVEDARTSAPACARGEGRAVGGDQRVDARLDPGEEPGVGDDRVAQAVAVDRTAGHRLRREVGERRGAGAAGGVEPVHRGVGVPDRHAGLGEEPAVVDLPMPTEPVRPSR